MKVIITPEREAVLNVLRAAEHELSTAEVAMQVGAGRQAVLKVLYGLQHRKLVQARNESRILYWRIDRTSLTRSGAPAIPPLERAMRKWKLYDERIE